MLKIFNHVSSLVKEKTGLLNWTGSFLAIIVLRVFIEQFLSKTIHISPYNIILEFAHNLFFFSLTILLIWLFVSYMVKENPANLSTIFLIASLLILFPPLIDMIKTQGEVFWSFYLVSDLPTLKIQFLTIFGHLPSGIVYFGTKIVFISAVILSGIIVYSKTRSIFRTLITFLGVYIILFVMGSFPSLFTFFYKFFFDHENISSIHDFEIAQFFGTPSAIWGVHFFDIKYSFAYKLELIFYPLLIILLLVLFYFINQKKFFLVLRNFRYPQIIYHSGLFFVGMGLAFLNFPDNITLDIFSFLAILVLLVSVWLAWKTSVVVNDIYDISIDKITNSWRPLPQEIYTLKEYWELGAVCFLLSLLGGLIIGFPFFVLLLIYQIIAWFYSAPPFRFKRFPLLATFISSLASLMILFLGYILVSSNQNITSLSWRVIILLVIAYTISIPIKDFKDIEGDKKYGVWTIPVIFGERKGRTIVAVCLFISYLMSVFFLNEFKLFSFAIIFGTLTYLTIISPKIKPRKLPAAVLSLVFIYGLILAKIILVDGFLK